MSLDVDRYHRFVLIKSELDLFKEREKEREKKMKTYLHSITNVLNVGLCFFYDVCVHD